MTITTPPGWYPEPGQTHNSPGIERWWDGTEWTEFTRNNGKPAPPAPPQVLPEPRRGGPSTGLIATAVGGVLLVAGGVVAGVALLGGDDGSRTAGKTASVPDRPAGHQWPSENGGLGARPGVLADPANGLTLPLPVEWQEVEIHPPDGFAYMRTRAFPCDYAPSGRCVHAGVYTVGLPAAADARAAAEQDVEVTARKNYGTLRSHEQVKAGPVTVAGREGYLVRWKVVPENGEEGYVQSVAIPSADGSSLIGIRFSFDARGGPDVRLMDEIVKRVRAVEGDGNPA